MAEPRVGESTTITFQVGELVLTLTGTVRQIYRPMGFSLEFENLTPSQFTALAAAVKALGEA